MIKEFFLKKLLKSQMKGVPEADQEKIMKMIEKDPGFFEKLAGEVQEELKTNKDQMAATMAVMMRHQEKLKDLMK